MIKGIDDIFITFKQKGLTVHFSYHHDTYVVDTFDKYDNHIHNITSTNFKDLVRKLYINAKNYKALELIK